MIARIKNLLVGILGAVALIGLLTGGFELWEGFWERTFVLPVMAGSTSWPTTTGVCHEHDIDRSWSRLHPNERIRR